MSITPPHKGAWFQPKGVFMKFLIYQKDMNKLPIHIKAKNYKEAEKIAKEMFSNEYTTILTLG